MEYLNSILACPRVSTNAMAESPILIRFVFSVCAFVATLILTREGIFIFVIRTFKLVIEEKHVKFQGLNHVKFQGCYFREWFESFNRVIWSV